MDDRAYKNAVQRRNELLRELSRVDAFLEMYREFGQLKETGKTDEDKAAATQSPSPRVYIQPDDARHKVSSRSTVRRLNPTKEQVAQKARELMIEAERPMTRGELLEALEDAGLKIHGSDPSKVLGTMMWRMGKNFVNFEGHGYWPADVPMPEKFKSENPELFD